MEGKYIKKCAEVSVAQTQKRCNIGEKDCRDEIEVSEFDILANVISVLPVFVSCTSLIVYISKHWATVSMCFYIIWWYFNRCI